MEEVKKEFNRKEYNQQYYKDKKSIKSICALCGGKTSPFNKFQHEHSLKHIKMMNEKKKPTLEEFTKLLLAQSMDLNLKLEFKDNTLVIENKKDLEEIKIN
jgi:epoxyqueuosine reductase QueG